MRSLRAAIVVGVAFASAMLGCEIEVPLDNLPSPDASGPDGPVSHDAAISGLDGPKSDSLPPPDAAMVVDGGSGSM